MVLIIGDKLRRRFGGRERFRLQAQDNLPTAVFGDARQLDHHARDLRRHCRMKFGRIAVRLEAAGRTADRTDLLILILIPIARHQSV